MRFFSGLLSLIFYIWLIEYCQTTFFIFLLFFFCVVKAMQSLNRISICNFLIPRILHGDLIQTTVSSMSHLCSKNIRWRCIHTSYELRTGMQPHAPNPCYPNDVDSSNPQFNCVISLWEIKMLKKKILVHYHSEYWLWTTLSSVICGISSSSSSSLPRIDNVIEGIEIFFKE